MPKKEPPKTIVEAVTPKRPTVTVSTNRKLRPKGIEAKKNGTNSLERDEFEDPDAEYFEDAISITDSDDMVRLHQLLEQTELIFSL